ncbi:low specificity L-threonine aldolase [Thioclava litoralis]|uniref:L-threonine aldolase n=1 Tax=Thioclava litoralis TaxID=3076557 RepID=A0ABZ1E0W5_9RHOB|nr:low specificity L-threonine aldolase [Thioclava sp. FTW29]
MNFGSDNTSAVAPRIMEAIQAANEGHARPYGGDALTPVVEARIRDIFEAPEARVFLVTSGTAANALSCALLTRPWEAIFCHRNAHIEEDECGAPEFFTDGAKLVLVEGEDAKMEPQALRDKIRHTGAAIHNIKRGMVSITNATEFGTVYTVDEVKALCDVAREFDLPVHMDGARFANAVVRLGCSPADLTWKAGVDVLSFGGTKNGCMGVEAVVVFDPARAQEFEIRRKRSGQLMSKHRYLAAQMMAYLYGDLWLLLARQANAMARKLADGLASLPEVRMLHPTQANAVFVAMPRHLHQKLHDHGAYYYFWPFDQDLEGDAEEVLSARLVCSWSTTTPEIETFLGLLDWVAPARSLPEAPRSLAPQEAEPDPAQHEGSR